MRTWLVAWLILPLANPRIIKSRQAANSRAEVGLGVTLDVEGSKSSRTIQDVGEWCEFPTALGGIATNASWGEGQRGRRQMGHG